MNKTSIEWVKNPDGSQGYTWNPITGCLNGCSYCYARRLANGRLKSRYLANSILPTHDEPDHEAHHADPFYPRFWEDRLFQPFNDKYISQKGIFVCDMSDLFGIGIPIEWTKAVMDVIEDCPQDRFYLLTKQPQNLPKWSPFPENCWVGITATDDDMMWTALTYLQEIEATIKYISFEPLLKWENPFIIDRLAINFKIIDWVIIGAQTKPYLCPQSNWIGEIVKAADHAGIPVFLKNNLYMIQPKRQEMPNTKEALDELET